MRRRNLFLSAELSKVLLSQAALQFFTSEIRDWNWRSSDDWRDLGGWSPWNWWKIYSQWRLEYVLYLLVCVCVSRQICVYIIYKHIHIILWIINIYRWYFCVFSLGPTFHQKIKIFQSPELVHQSSYTDASKISLSDWCFRMSYLALSPFPVTVITRIIISLVGNP